MNATEHDGEKLQALLDGRLSADERARVDAHVQACSTCQKELRALKWVKSVAAGAPEIPLPSELPETLRRALDLEDRRDPAAETSLGGLKLWAVGWRLAASVVVALGAVVTTVIMLAKLDAPELAASDFLAVQSGELELQMRTVDGPQLERFFGERNISFPTRVFDLAMMNYHVTGGRVHAMAGGPSALFAYEGETGTLVVCQMYEGHVEGLPEGAELHVHEDIRFYVFREEALTVVFWQEGDVTCVMTSDIDSEALIQLAFAKAIKV